MTQALIAFGANLGDSPAALEEAARRLADHPEIEVMAVAKPLKTAAVTGEDDGSDNSADRAPEYLNSAILVETPCTAQALFSVTCAIENEMGRERRERWGPRTIDLDIILFGRQIIDGPEIQVPHRRMSFRKFVLGPAAEIAGDLIDPISGIRLKELADRLQQSPKTILWIADENGVAQSTVNQFDGSGWGFNIVPSLEAVDSPLHDFRLMLFSNPAEKFRETAVQFAGPWLNLSELPQQQWQTEIRGAIQAMT